MEAWIWMVIGLALCGGELIVTAFVMLILGLGAILTGATVWLFSIGSIYIQLVIFIIYSVIFSIAFYVYYKKSKSITIGQSNQFLGEIGMITQAYDKENYPEQNGLVRFQKPILGSDIWECRCESNLKLNNGDRVRLIKFEGKIVIVELNQVN